MVKERIVGTKMEKGFDEPYNKVKFKKHERGAVSISNADYCDEGFVYLYKDQVKELKKFLGFKTQKDGSTPNINKPKNTRNPGKMEVEDA